MSIRVFVHRLLNVLVLLSILLSPVQPLVSAGPQAAAQAILADEGADTPTPPSPQLFRTRVTVRNPSDWTRLEQLGVVVLAEDKAADQGGADRGSADGRSVLPESTALILADEDQLEAVARLRFEPRDTDELGALVTAHAQEKPWLVAGVRLVLQAWEEHGSAEFSDRPLGQDDESENSANPLFFLSPALKAALATLTSLDDDGDGLTNAQESFWCTDPEDEDTDDDGKKDGEEIQVLKDWMANRRDGPPSPPDTPWPDWPPQRTDCPDKDHDSIPNLAERWELGLSMDLESTDQDKYDDGQELFGTTYCPGGDLSCGYGDLPRSEDSGYVGRDMPSGVKAPGKHPYVAAYPVIHVDWVPDSIEVRAVTELHLDETVITGTAKTYGIAETRGTSVSVAETVMWNEWQEVSVSTPIGAASKLVGDRNFVSTSAADTAVDPAVALAVLTLGAELVLDEGKDCLLDELDRGTSRCRRILENRYEYADSLGSAWQDTLWNPNQDIWQNALQLGRCAIDLGGCAVAYGLSFLEHNRQRLQQKANSDQDTSMDRGGAGSTIIYEPTSNMVSIQPVFQMSFPVPRQLPTRTETHGRSWGGAHTTTHTEYQEHTISQSEQFSSEYGWTSGWARNTAHSADLTFDYRISNVGTDYARSFSNLILNVYIGRDPHPDITCQTHNPPPDRNCNLVESIALI